MPKDSYKHYLCLKCTGCHTVFVLAGQRGVRITRVCPIVVDDGFLCAHQLEEADVGASVLRAFANKVGRS